MNILDNSFSPTEAQLRYKDADFDVIRPGTFVRCAITGVPIALDDLAYWSVDRQQPYADAQIAARAWAQEHGRRALDQ